MLLRVLRAVHWALRILVIVTFAALLLAVLLQVTARLTPGVQAPVWTEEFSRFALLFGAAFGAGLALLSGDLVNVDIVTSQLSMRTRRLLEIVVMLVVIAFSASLILPGWDYVDIGSLQTSPALGWNMFYVHMSVLLVPITLALAALERLLILIAGEAR